MNIGEAIKKGRKRKKLNQKELASMMDVSCGTISHWEQNTRSPQAKDLIKLANMLDIVTDLFPGYMKSDTGGFSSELVTKMQKNFEQAQEKNRTN